MSTYDLELEWEEGIKEIEFKPNSVVAFGDNANPKLPTVKPDTSKSKITIKVDCDHNEDKDTAKWFNDKINNEVKRIVHTRGGDNPPNQMYVAYDGVLIINGYKFDVTIGMNSSGSYNRWNLNSWNILASSDEKEGYILGARAEDLSVFKITTSGSSKFKFEIYK